MKRYWAGGFGNKYLSADQNAKKLREFLDGSFWQGIYYDKNDKSELAIEARDVFSQISVGDEFLIKGLGGRYDLVVHFVGEVVAKDDQNYRLDLASKNVTRYYGKAPRGQGAGKWFNTILEVRRPQDIQLLF